MSETLMTFKTPTREQVIERTLSGKCILCANPFTSDNVYTDAGWRETQISHTCEKCFDALFADDED
jgi:hypothetical protein